MLIDDKQCTLCSQNGFTKFRRRAKDRAKIQWKWSQCFPTYPKASMPDNFENYICLTTCRRRVDSMYIVPNTTPNVSTAWSLCIHKSITNSCIDIFDKCRRLVDNCNKLFLLSTRSHHMHPMQYQ